MRLLSRRKNRHGRHRRPNRKRNNAQSGYCKAGHRTFFSRRKRLCEVGRCQMSRVRFRHRLDLDAPADGAAP